MKILIVGSGGREHTIAYKLSKEDKVSKIYCAPGNVGISEFAQNVNIKVEDIDALANFAKNENIDLTIVGPEIPLVLGIVDKFEEMGLRIFGPNKKCSELEGSKCFAKDFMIRHEISTAKYMEFNNIEDAKSNIGIYGYPVVIKADGLAAGKGVIIVNDENEGLNALKEIMDDKKFGKSGEKIVLEEFLKGIETSILAFVDENTIIPMVSAKDHKKIFDNEVGENTGGMGTFSPSLIYDEKLEKEVEEKVLMPILKGLQKDNLDYKGILFIGLMVDEEGPKVLEFNVRFGDPETQSVLTRLESSLVDIMESILDNKLKNADIKWSTKKAVCVILASKGYPDAYEKGKIINGLNDIDKDIMIFHSGTKLEKDSIVTNGGRVLGVTAIGETLEEATKKVYANIEKIKFEGMQYRKDIGAF